MAEQTEKAFLKQPKVFLSSKKSGKGKRLGKGGNRFYKSIGLNFKTPREAIEVKLLYLGSGSNVLVSDFALILDKEYGKGVRKIREAGKLLTKDIERLLLSEENRFDFVNEVAAEAKEYMDNNRDEYGSKKAILHVLSNRVNDVGFSRPEAYMDPDPYKPGPSYLREEHI
ncbi:hypothetical protein IFM89_025331 [Coptis chinensis]|uniref:Small ribosomal subunit protein uS17 N-terminal domain-containing protein n=1 Tax=Coptis chinensis TaxID=261450 RepID=A0A835M1M9_9MAGN|nr:hypothetical protein IFM89_025331 [Coptis chinensis]